MAAPTPREQLRESALRRAAGLTVDAAEVVSAAEDALIAGDDSPSLRELAALTHRERETLVAFDLLALVAVELGLNVPDDHVDARWELVAYWLRSLLAERLSPIEAVRLVAHEGWQNLGQPDRLTAFAGHESEWDDWRPDWKPVDSRERIELDIVNDARAFLQWWDVDRLK